MRKYLVLVLIVMVLLLAVTPALAITVPDEYADHIVNDHALSASQNQSDNSWHNPGVMHQGKSGWPMM